MRRSCHGSIAHVGNLAEKRFYRLLDDRASGFSRQRAAEPDIDAGLITVHKAAAANGVSLRTLVAPVRLIQTESSFGQENVISMVLPALERLQVAIRHAYVLLAHEAFAATTLPRCTPGPASMSRRTAEIGLTVRTSIG